VITEYQQKIINLAGIEFEDVQDTDILTWDYFDQGFGVRGWYYLYKPDGSLKDLKCGKPIPISERKFTRPMHKSSRANYGEEKGKSEKKIKHPKVIAALNPVSVAPEKIKEKRNLSPEERARRAERMRAVAQAYWSEKRKNSNNAVKPILE